jgi:branched-chain amino acid transport system ATP-binding protein
MWRPAGSNRDVIDEAVALMDRLKLTDDAGRPVRELPYGRQRLVEIAIALGLKPRVLLLDEPAAGVPTAEHGILLDVIENLPTDISILIIEHDMDVVFRFATEITVLVGGGVLTVGTPEEVRRDERVRAVYLGQRADD